jgi:membrane protease subunit HflC
VKDYGIEIVDLRIKRIGLPSQVRDSVFERMRKERARMARQYRSEGEAKAMTIRATADKDRTILLAAAYADAEKVRGEAEAQAIKIYGQAHQKDPAFYELLRTLEAYKKILDEKTTILLSGDSELLKFLTHGSMLEGQGVKK